MIFVKVKDLESTSKGFDIKIKVVSKDSEREVNIKKTGLKNRVANFTVGDETGTITLTVWGSVIDEIPIDEVIQIQKAYVREFNGSLYLNIGQYSSWEISYGDLEVKKSPNARRSKKFANQKMSKICNLLNQKKGINLNKVKVVEINNIRQVRFKKDGTTHEVADALIADETGCIKVSLWDEAINSVTEDMILKIHNAYITEFKGSKQLNLSRFSKLEILPQEDFFINTDNNISIIGTE